MFSKLNLGKYRDLIALVLVFLALVLMVLFFNIYTSYQIESVASRINVAGSQRAMTQTISKAILNAQQEKRDAQSMDNSLAELRASVASFDANLAALKASAEETAVLGFLSLNTQDTQQAAAAVLPLWADYKGSLQPVLKVGGLIEASDLANAAAQSKALNQRLMAANNRLVETIEDAVESKAQTLRWIQLFAVLLAVAVFVYIARTFSKKLDVSDKKIESAEQETAAILNTVDEGLLLIDAQGKIGSQMSKAVHTLFGKTVQPGDDFRQLVTRLVDTERADEINIYIDLLFDPKVKPALLVQLDPMKEIELLSQSEGKSRFLSFNLRQLRSGDVITGLLVTVFDVTNTVGLERELANSQSDARTDVEDLLHVFEQDPATMQEFLDEINQKIATLNESMRTVGKTSSAYKELIKKTAITIHSIKGESATLSLTGVSRQAHTMEDSMALLLKRQDITGEDLITVVYELSRVQEQVERIEKLFSRIRQNHSAQRPVNAQPAAPSAAQSVFLKTESNPLSAPSSAIETPPPALNSILNPAPNPALNDSAPAQMTAQAYAIMQAIGAAATNAAAPLERVIASADAPSPASQASQASQPAAFQPKVSQPSGLAHAAVPVLNDFILTPRSSSPGSPNNRSAAPSARDILSASHTHEFDPSALLNPATAMFAGNLPPLEELSNNLKTLATEVAKSLNKTVKLHHSIEAVMPSGMMLRVLREVLPQLVRNSVVHGIESSFERIAAGKPEQGQLELTMVKRSKDVTEVSLKDDGRGITVDSIAQRLKDMGVDTEGMNPGQILQHIFNPEFSTAIHVTEHAGRGVGLAVVKEALEKAGAKLKVNTRPGQSTEFVIHFGQAA